MHESQGKTSEEYVPFTWEILRSKDIILLMELNTKAKGRIPIHSTARREKNSNFSLLCNNKHSEFKAMK